MKILKFGGTSLADPGAIRRAVAIVERARRDNDVAVVVSAFGGVTDALLEAAQLAAGGDGRWRERSDALRDRHLEVVEALTDAEDRDALRTEVDARCAQLGDLLHGVSLVRESSPRTTDRIVSTGELLSAAIVAGALRRAGVDAEPCDTRSLVLTDRAFGCARVDEEATAERLRAHFDSHPRLQVVTGFLGATDRGATTTLGRGGSDLTASLLGVALGADEIQLWTDVSGVMSTDPRVVSDAFPIPHLSYDELMELSHFGAKVVYPPTVHPARVAGIPLVIRNTFEPEAPGTRVTADGAGSGGTVRGLASIPRVALMRLEGDGMVGVPGIAQRLFGALAGAGISVALISQASSEHSICFAIDPDDAGEACRAVDAEFALERGAGLVEALVCETDLAIVAVVGQGMCRAVGIAGRLFGVLGAAGVNVRAIAQGSSELNVSLVVAADARERALATLHERFFRPQRPRVDLVVVGKGNVGQALLDQLAERRDDGVEIRLVGVAGRERSVFRAAGLDPAGWRTAVDDGEPTDLAHLADALRASRAACRIVVDCTADDDPSHQFETLLAAGVSVVSANKRPFAGPFDRWAALHRAAAEGGAALLYEATVGAGLPVLTTLADLVGTGDRVQAIEGVLSGTLNFVLGRVMDGARLSDAVREASDAGLTEPHPADDLGGADVARKLLILGRAAGWRLAHDAVSIDGLLPDAGWRQLDLDTFWARLPELDPVIEARATAARDAGRGLTFIGRVTPHGANVGVVALPPQHPAAGLPATDNLVSFTTDRYPESPLVVRGPGAGPQVTAAGVMADIRRAAALLLRNGGAA